MADATVALHRSGLQMDPLAGSSCCPAIRAREAAVLALAAFFVAVIVFVMNGGGRFPT
ncbi:hypothetical protein AB0O74_32595 [Streptomyces rubiginosohelvolus]|uniref:hypothetical protein n=1 Tax=Streptomyces rubiginosohelvolus TaxID=67362 RepID=UPI00343A2C58|nr:hypothetical protein OG475_33975 [Streptomyces rubiginosohelvolus]